MGSSSDASGAIITLERFMSKLISCHLGHFLGAGFVPLLGYPMQVLLFPRRRTWFVICTACLGTHTFPNSLRGVHQTMYVLFELALIGLVKLCVGPRGFVEALRLISLEFQTYDRLVLNSEPSNNFVLVIVALLTSPVLDQNTAAAPALPAAAAVETPLSESVRPTCELA